MKPEKNHSQTSVGASIYISPIDHITGDVAGLLANFLDALLVRFYPRRICQKVNVVVTELVTNVIQHGTERESEVRLDLSIDPDRLLIKVSNRVTPEEYRTVKAVFDEIFAALVKIIVASAVMSAAAYGAYYLLHGYFVEKPLTVRLIEAFVPIGLAGLTFMIAAKLLKIGELEKIVSAVSRRFSR